MKPDSTDLRRSSINPPSVRAGTASCQDLRRAAAAVLKQLFCPESKICSGLSRSERFISVFKLLTRPC